MPKVSFIIPIYNCELHVEECLKGILETGLDEFEIILVDDGSKDNSGVICNDWAQKYKEIHVIHQKNAGVSAARNVGIQKAEGDYIVCLDADDNIESEKIRNVVEIISKSKDIDLLIYGISFDYFKNGKCYRRDKLSYPREGILEKDEWCAEYYNLFMANSLSPVWNKIFKRDIIIKNHLQFSEKMFLYEDLEFVFQYMAYCNVIYNSTEIIYHYRQPEDEGKAKRRIKKIKSLNNFIYSIEKTLNEEISRLEIKEDAVRLEMRKILSRLYFWLTREKIDVSSRKEIKEICEEMRLWYNEHIDLFDEVFSKDERYLINKIINKQENWLIMNRTQTWIRHQIAVKVKNTTLYQRWKG